MNRRPPTGTAGTLTLLMGAALAVSLAACTPTEPVINSRILAFGTLVDISILGVPREQAEEAAQRIAEDFDYMHQAWHAWDPGPLGRTNTLLATGDPFAAPPSVMPLILEAKEISRQTEGLFNPAIGKLIARWGFHSDEPHCVDPPSGEEIARLLEEDPQMSDIQVDGIMLQSTNPAVQLDFGGFGKGYGIDLAVEHLKELGIRNAIVNAGGDLRAIGSRDGQPWRIAIRRPSGTGVFATIYVRGDESVFTSGNYERRYACDGKSYHHIIDPRTGYPAEGTQSVTVVHDDASVADAAATALFVAGPQRWHEIARRMGLRYVLLVDSDGVIHLNPRMQERLNFLSPAQEIRVSAPLPTHERAAD